MNERIRELARQAGITTNLDTDYFEKHINRWVDYYSEKFAELIVRECATVVASVSPCFGDYRDQIEVNLRDYCAKKIMEHFGVEE